MKNKELIDALRKLKEKEDCTLYELSRKLDIQVSTLERWFKTDRINRIYAQYIKDKLSLP